MAEYAGWKDTYQSRLKGLSEAMELIAANDLVGVTILAPAALVEAVAKRGREVGGIGIRTLAPSNPLLFGEEAPPGEKEIEIFIGDIARPSHDAKVTTYLPTTFTLGMKAFDQGREEARIPDVWVTPCSPPNEAGYVHFGPHQWLRKSYAKRCKTVICVVDPGMMPVHGDVWVHVSEVTAFVEGAVPPVDMEALARRIDTETPEADRPRMRELLRKMIPEVAGPLAPMLPLVPPAQLEALLRVGPPDAAAQGIADNLRQILRNGDTIQVGVGEPSQLMFNAGAFDDLEHLGLHTELGSPGMAKLWQRGILDNSLKTLHKGRCVAVAWSGCDGEDMAIIRDNPAFELYDPDYLLNPLLMGQNRQMTSINSAIAVDLLGQIASEDRFGGNMVNGTGGQPDTHISAALCKDGRAITVLRSTAMDGALSKIVAKHEAGTLVTIPRYLADTIVTEFGVARLLDKNHRQRAEELISIAHPDYRAELRNQASELWG
jgi:4-hydroxybutyrate CoA-transferase